MAKKKKLFELKQWIFSVGNKRFGKSNIGLPRWFSGKKSACQCRRQGFNPWFSSPVATAEFSKFASILSKALSQHHLSGFEIAQLEFHPLH